MLGVKRMPRPLSESRKPESRRKTAVLRGMLLRPIDSPPGFPGQPCALRERAASMPGPCWPTICTACGRKSSAAAFEAECAALFRPTLAGIEQVVQRTRKMTALPKVENSMPDAIPPRPAAASPLGWTGDITRVPYWVYRDPSLLKLEQNRIFEGPVWNFLCFEDEIA